MSVRGAALPARTPRVSALPSGIALAVVTTLVINALHFKLTEAFRLILVSDTLYLALTPTLLIITLLLFTAVTALASLWPAFRAAKMQPVTAIQSVS